MATYKSVFDYMQDASNKLNHEAMFRARLVGEGMSELKPEDLLPVELALLSTTERNLLSGVDMPAKFRIRNCHANGLTVTTTAVAKVRGAVGRSELSHGDDHTIDFVGHGETSLVAERCSVAYSPRTDALVARDRVITGRVAAACANMCEGESADLAVTLAAERITCTGDMRHMLTKMYLMLCDLVLAETSHCMDWEYASDLQAIHSQNITGAALLAAIVRYDVVIDLDGFTDMERELVWLAAGTYPPVKFAGDNIYNSICMEADSVRLVSKGPLHAHLSMQWDPESMYRAIIGLACKLGCLEDWWWVMKRMRGMPVLLRDIRLRTGDACVVYGVPLSSHHGRALGEALVQSVIPSRYPGYIATSISLVADAMLGHALVACASCVVEQLGGYGTLIFPGSGYSSQLYGSLLRDYGLGIMNPRLNALLLVWSQVTETDQPFNYRDGLTHYIHMLTGAMRSGTDGVWSQLLFDVAYMDFKDCSWGVTRGGDAYGGFDLRATDKARDAHIRTQAAKLWAMGVRKQRPELGANMEREGEVRFGASEYSFLAGATGAIDVSWVTYTLKQEPGARRDYGEQEATALIAAAFKGGRCTVELKEGVEWDVRYIGAPDADVGITETLGLTGVRELEIPAEDVIPVTYGGSKVVAFEQRAVKLPEFKRDSNHRRVNLTVNHNRYNQPQFVERVANIGGTSKSETGVLVSKGEVSAGSKCRLVKYDTPGDGRCGIHALVKGFEISGMISGGQRSLAVKELDRITTDTVWHDTETVAAAAGVYGVGVRVHRETGDGRLDTTYYNTRAREVFDIHYRDGKYSAATVGHANGDEYTVEAYTPTEITEATASRVGARVGAPSN